MDFVTKLDDTLLLENNKVYNVHKQIKFEGKNYVILKEYEFKLSYAIGIEPPKTCVGEEVIDENDSFFIRPVSDETTLKKLNDYLKLLEEQKAE